MIIHLHQFINYVNVDLFYRYAGVFRCESVTLYTVVLILIQPWKSSNDVEVI